jgi:hypothetical protein
MCTDALDNEPECLPLLLIRARAQIALRRDLDAQADLRDIIRLDPSCSVAYRLLGVLAARRDENGPAAVFFREAVRLDPGDREAHDWLMIVDAALRPAARPARPSILPAPAPVAGRGSPRPEPVVHPRLARGTQPPGGVATRAPAEPTGAPAGTPAGPPAGTYEERPTKPFARGSERHGDAWRTPVARPVGRPREVREVREAPMSLADGPLPKPTLTGRPPVQPPAKEAPRLVPRSARSATRSAIPELPGFGEYLVTAGILSRERLRAAQAYQRSMKVQLSTAIVTLGLATPQRIEWAAVTHQSELARERLQ